MKIVKDPRITTEEIKFVARFHGEPANGHLIRENIGQALEYHGKDAPANYDGDARRFWGIDPVTRQYDAARLLQGYIAEETRCARAEADQAQREYEQAYGDD